MNKSILRLIEKSAETKIGETLDIFARVNDVKVNTEPAEADREISREEALAIIDKAQELMYVQFTGEDFNGVRMPEPGINLKEALNSTDVSVVFPRVISSVLQEPTEPALFLSNVVAEEIRLTDQNPLYIEFPTVGALQAAEVTEDGEYPSATLNFSKQMTSIRVQKWGLQSSLSEETINQSIYPLVTMMMRLLKNAVDRRIEALLFNNMTSNAPTIYDNTGATANSLYTTGVGSDGATANYTFSHYDLIHMCGTLIANRYQATHLLAHPMAWPILALDPIMRATFYTGGAFGQAMWNTAPAFDQQMNMPFGITYVPYYALATTSARTQLSAGPGSGLASTLISDFYLIDKSNSLFLATKGQAEMDSIDDWYKDAKSMKIRRYAGATAKDGGRGMCVAKNLRAERNYEALFTVLQV